MRGLTTAFRASVIGLPVDWSAERTVGTSAEGLMPFRTAQAPATCGVAIEVPLRTANALPGTDELIADPGASSSTSGDEFENDEMTSDLSVEPTVIADEMQAGKLTALVKPLLPDAIATAMPFERSVSMIGLRASVSRFRLSMQGFFR